MAKVLAVMAINPDYEQFAVPELKSLLRRMDVPLHVLLKDEVPEFPQHEYEINYKNFKNFPFIVLNVPDFEKHREYLTNAAKSTVMVSKLVLLISQGQCLDDMINNYDKDIVAKELSNWETRVYCQFISRNRTISREEQLVKIDNALGKMNIRGKVDISNPEVVLAMVEDHVWFQKHHQLPSKETLRKTFFGIQLSSNRPIRGTAKFNLKYQLSNRIYLGPTSTDNDLSFLMCHQGMIDSNSFVLDPFVGTGSLLLPPSHYGAYAFGSDLDIRVLNGYSVGQINKKSKFYGKQKHLEMFTPKILLSFTQYQLKRPEIFRMDCLSSRFREKEIFDAIICDPPYGLRAMSRTLTNKDKQEQSVQPGPQTNPQIPHNQVTLEKTQQPQNGGQQSQDQELQEKSLTEQQAKQALRRRQRKQILKQRRRERKELLPEQEKSFKRDMLQKLSDERQKKWTVKPKIQCTDKNQIYNGLLVFAAEYLRQGGYLVFLYPVLEQEESGRTADQLPRHPNFELVDFSTQKLIKGNIRILVTMRKKIQE